MPAGCSLVPTDRNRAVFLPSSLRPTRLAPFHSPPSRSGAHAPNPVVLWGCLRIYAGEVVIDVIKHAVLGKFNEIRWGAGGLAAVCLVVVGFSACRVHWCDCPRRAVATSLACWPATAVHRKTGSLESACDCYLLPLVPPQAWRVPRIHARPVRPSIHSPVPQHTQAGAASLVLCCVWGCRSAAVAGWSLANGRQLHAAAAHCPAACAH